LQHPWRQMVFRQPAGRHGGQRRIAALARQVANRSQRDARHESRRSGAIEGVHHPPHGTLPSQLWAQRGDRAASMRVCRHHQPRHLPSRRNRRTAFLAIKVGTINIDKLESDRDQLFAEAVVRYREGASWWPEKDFERSQIMPQQAQRYEPDAWEENIAAYIQTKSKVTIGEVAGEVLHIDLPRIGTAEQRRIAAALEQLGWERLPKDSDGKRWWAKRGATEQSK
jgi:hypothetical protein